MSQEAKDKQASAAIATYMNLLKLSGSDTASVQPMFPTILATCRSGSSRVYGELAEMVSTAAATGPGFRKLMVEQNVPEFLREMRPTLEKTSPSGLKHVDKALALLEGADVVVKAEPADVVTVKKAVSTLQVSMDNLLGVRAEEDRYIRAILKIDEVTSVTLDKKKEIGLVYHTADEAHVHGIKAKIYAALQTVCDEIMDARGQDRFVVRGDDYLDGDDGEDEEFFADGGALTQTEAVKELSADELIKQRDADRQMSLGLLGWVKSWVW